MARFKINTPVRDFSGESAGVRFHRGEAEVSTDSDYGVSALSYFRQAGYGIEPLDGVSVDDALRTQTLTPEAEAAQLRAEIDRLNDAKDLASLREERDRLAKEVEEQRAKDAERAKADKIRVVGEDGPRRVDLPPGSTVLPTRLPDPPDSDRVADWRPYAVGNLGVTEAQAKAMNTNELRGLYENRKAQLEGGAR